MKNLFNNISQEEKNRILEMHSAKKNVISEQFELDDKPRPNQKINIVGKTVNLYRDKFSKNLMVQLKIISDIQDPASKKVKIGVDINPFVKKGFKNVNKVELVFNCETSDDDGFLVLINGKPFIDGNSKVFTHLFNPNLIGRLLEKYCSFNDSSKFVPKADFVMNNTQDDSTNNFA
jgi:hypothetical protein